MNVIGPGTLNGVMVTAMTADVASLLTDTDTGVTAVVFTPDGAAGIDPITGLRSHAGTSDSVTAYLAPLELAEVDASGGTYERGDQCLMVLASDLNAVPSTESTFRVGANRYTVITADLDPLSVHWQLVGRPTNRGT